jgi:hypothetical protein
MVVTVDIVSGLHIFSNTFLKLDPVLNVFEKSSRLHTTSITITPLPAAVVQYYSYNTETEIRA